MALLLALAACGEARSPTVAPARELNLYSWSDFIAPEVVTGFEKETGIKVNLVLFPSQEALEATLLTGRSSYDVVVAGGNFVGRLARAGAIRVLERSRLPNWKNLDTEVLALLATDDAGNRYAVPYDWGTTAIAYNVEKLRQLAPDAPLDSWRLFLDPAVISRYAACGVSVVDSPNDVLGAVLVADGKDPNSTDPADYEAAARQLMAIRPYVRKLDSDMQINDLASGDICLMLTWTSNFVIARRRAAEAGSGGQFRYMIPREGTAAFIDALSIPADAPHLDAAYAFIDYTLRPDVAAVAANFLGNASANAAALPRIEPLLRNDPQIYPPSAQRSKLQPLHSHPDSITRVVTRIWTQFRTGH